MGKEATGETGESQKEGMVKAGNLAVVLIVLAVIIAVVAPLLAVVWK